MILAWNSGRDWDTSVVTDYGLRYFDDYLPGATYDCGIFSVNEEEIVSFAEQFDPQPFHVDPGAAARGPFGGLIASGWHTAALVMRQLVDHYLPAEASLGSPGLDEMRWPDPVRPGIDEVQVTDQHADPLEPEGVEHDPPVSAVRVWANA